MTFSIVARDPRNGMLGIATASKALAAASKVYVRSGVGAIASQSFGNPYLAIDGLELLAQGLPAERAIERLIDSDPGRDLRQLAIVDKEGRVAAYTGSRCISWAGSIAGGGYICAGNILAGEDVVTAMGRAFEYSREEDLAERLVLALEAGQEAGGDRRGRQAAGVHVVADEEYPLVDLRVDDHFDPIGELRRVFEIWKAKPAALRELNPRRDNFAPDLESLIRRREQIEEELNELQAVKES